MPMIRILRKPVLAFVLAALVGACGGSDSASGGQGATTANSVQIKTLSNRAELISGGDALVEILLPRGADASKLRVDVEGFDISDAFAPRANGRIIGLVSGMEVGENVLTARLPGGSGARLTINNHPIGGPVFSGPQIQPWTCAPGAIDDQCNRDPEITYQYKSALTGQFADYDPDNPPPDVAMTTTDEGVTVPYIVRIETGAIDRDEYRIAVLTDPEAPWEPWAPQGTFNHKLVITHGASCDTSYEQGEAPDVMLDVALSRGFAVMSNALNNSGHNCNVVVQAESMVMTKERVVDTLGELRYTIGTGCSGGALAQYWMANAYPGLYQGISPACSFADAWSSAIQYTDYVLLRGYFEQPQRWSPGVVWGPLELESVYGHPNPLNPITFTEVIPNSGIPNRDCPGVPASDVYHPQNNPEGVRCTLHDYTVNAFGRRPESMWTENEQLLGRGFAQRPYDNVGVQYGLNGLLNGTLTADQFVDVNEKTGGADIDYNLTTERAPAGPDAITRVYRSGAVNVANNLDQVAIIDLRGPDPGAFHDAYRAYALRARLVREHGHHDNQLIWRGPVALLGDATFTDESILALDQWLAAVEADPRDIPLAQKIVEDRPANVTERCTDGLGNDIPARICDVVVDIYASPRIHAGMPFTDDVMKCQLKPLVREDYPGITFTDEQWQRLQDVFPTGVCDFSKPGVDFTPTEPWLTYQDGPGGQPLGEAPRSTTF